MSVVVRARPAFIVGAVDRFVVVGANELDPADLAKGRRPAFRSLSWTGPRLVGAELPSDPAKRNELLFSGVAGKDVERYPEYYVEFHEVAPALLQRAKPLDQLALTSPSESEALDRIVEEIGRPPEGLVYLPLASRRANLTMLLDSETGEPLKALALDPWPEYKIKQTRHDSGTPEGH
jgi:hypothetical protein